MRVSSITAVAAAYLAAGQVEAQVGEGERLVGVVLVGYDAPQQRAQPGQQLLQRERLGEVVVGAGVEALDPVTDGVAGGQHQDGYVVPGGAQRPGGLDAVEPGHHHVHHDDVRADPADPGQRLGPVGRQRDGVPVELERPPQRLPDRLVVVDDEDAGSGRGSVHAPNCAKRA